MTFDEFKRKYGEEKIAREKAERLQRTVDFIQWGARQLLGARNAEAKIAAIQAGDALLRLLRDFLTDKDETYHELTDAAITLQVWEWQVRREETPAGRAAVARGKAKSERFRNGTASEAEKEAARGWGRKMRALRRDADAFARRIK